MFFKRNERRVYNATAKPSCIVRKRLVVLQTEGGAKVAFSLAVLVSGRMCLMSLEHFVAPLPSSMLGGGSVIVSGMRQEYVSTTAKSSYIVLEK